jgi:4-amino-4-deoxy-L-arabinose transferase-like glycosyltransferase
MNWSSRGLAFLAVVAIWAAIYLPRLGDCPLRGEEPTRAMPGYTMLETGRWMVPSVDGKDYFNKPPMVNWLVAASYAVTGTVTEFSARLPSVLMILAFASMVMLTRSGWLELPGQLVVAVISLTTLLMVERGRQIEIEATYVAFTGMAVLWWLNVWAGKGSRWSLWLVPALFLSAAALAKGPFHGLVFYSVAVGVLLYERRLRELISIQHICGVLIILVLCLGWVCLAKLDSTAQQMTSQWWKQLEPRVIPKLETFNLHWTLPGALRDFLPWALFLPLLWVRRFTSLIPREHQRMFKGCRLGMVVGLALLAAMPRAIPRYVMPIQPVMAMMVGWVLSRHREPIPSDRIWVWAILAGFALEAAAAAAILVASCTGLEASLTGLKVVSSAWHDWYAWVACAAAMLAVILAVAARSKLKGGVRLSVATSLTVVVSAAIYFGFGVPLFVASDSFRPVSTGINKLVPAGQTTYVFRPVHEVFLFSVHQPVRYLQTPEQIGPDVRYLVVAAKLHSATPGLDEVLARRAGRRLCQFECEKGKFDLLTLDPGPTSGPAK